MKIDMTEVHSQKTALSTSQTSLSNQIETAKSSFVNLVNSESLKGDVKSAINAKISNHQIPLLTNFSNAMSVLSAQYDKTIEQFQTTVSETAADAIIDTEYLQGILGSFAGLETNIASVDRETASIYNSISDIISLTNPDASTITTPLSEGKTILTDTKTNMTIFNGWQRGDELSTVLQSQTQTLESLSNLGQLSFSDKEARAFYSSQDFLKAVKEVSSKANSSTPVELLGLVSKVINKDLGKNNISKKNKSSSTGNKFLTEQAQKAPGDFVKEVALDKVGDGIEKKITEKATKKATEKSAEIFANRYSTVLSNGKIMGKVPGATRAAQKASETAITSTAKNIGKALSTGVGMLAGVGIDMLSGDSAEVAWGRQVTTTLGTMAVTTGIEVGSAYLAGVGVLANPVGLGVVATVGIGMAVGFANEWARETFPEFKKAQDEIGKQVVTGWNNLVNGVKGLFSW